jgi:hypothetical protein
LPGGEPDPEKLERRGEHREVDEKAEAADRAKHYEAHRHDTTDQLVEEQLQIFQRDQRIELVFAMQPRAEREGQLLEGERAGRRGKDVDQELVALGRKAAHRGLEHRAPEDEEAAHRVGELGLDDEPRQTVAPTRSSSAREAPDQKKMLTFLADST